MFDEFEPEKRSLGDPESVSIQEELKRYREIIEEQEHVFVIEEHRQANETNEVYSQRIIGTKKLRLQNVRNECYTKSRS